MPRFFFHIRDEYGLIEDTEGQDLPDTQAVVDEIARATREISGEPCPSRLMCFEVVDAEGRLVHAARIPGLVLDPSLLNAASVVRNEGEIGPDCFASRIQT